MEEKPKIQAWGMNQDSSPSQHKDILPGDQVNQQAAVSAAYNNLGETMAKEEREEAEYNDDVKQMYNEMSEVQFGVSWGSNAVGVDKAVAGGLAYYLVKIVYWCSHPIPGLRQSKTATIIFSLASVLASLIVLMMIYVGIAGMDGPFGRWLTETYHSIFGTIRT